ncbi:sulfatase-like hydrolase/transferase, partial [bacterium]|nr:sulfatase-like hydrolase/transferase [bacterium]
MNKSSTLFLQVILACFLSIVGCSKNPDKKPNILFISIDSLRRDHLSCYGYFRETTPNIDKLAAKGTIFDNAISTTCWTLPSHMSMFTGLYNMQHGV